MIRLRQVALVATELAPVVEALTTTFGLTVCFHDPGVAEFGLHNALMVVGDQFIEVVSPTAPGTTAGRLLEKREGDGGYMAIFEVDDLDHRMARLTAEGVRVVWAADTRTIRARHLHPRDVGGAIVSLDEPAQWGTWTWGGPTWAPSVGAATAIAGVAIAADDPSSMRARWRTLGLDTGVRFVEASGRGEGLDEVDLVARDRDQVGESYVVGGVTFRFV